MNGPMTSTASACLNTNRFPFPTLWEDLTKCFIPNLYLFYLFEQHPNIDVPAKVSIVIFWLTVWLVISNFIFMCMFAQQGWTTRFSKAVLPKTLSNMPRPLNLRWRHGASNHHIRIPLAGLAPGHGGKGQGCRDHHSRTWPPYRP